MEISLSSEQTNNINELKTENEKLISEILELRKIIYDLRNSHIHLTIKEDTTSEKEENDSSSDSDSDSDNRNIISPYEQMMVCKKHMISMWNNKKNETDWPFKIDEDMANLEITRRKEALKLWEERMEEDEIYDMCIDDAIYLSDGLLVVEVNDEEELGDVVGYIDPNICENDAEQVIFFK